MKTFIKMKDPKMYKWWYLMRWVNDYYASLKKKLWMPFNYKKPNYPDDEYKTDVCWGFFSKDNPDVVVAIWNYKNGHYDNKNLWEIDCFSFYCSWTQEDVERFAKEYWILFI